MRKPAQVAAAILLLAGASPAATLSAPDQVANPGDSVLLSLSLSSGGQSVSGIQFDLAWDAGLDIDVASGSEVGVSAKTLYVNPLQTRVLRCLVAGMNGNNLADGELIRLFVTVESGAPAGVAQLRLLTLSATDRHGAPVLLTANAITINVQAGSATQGIQRGGFLNAASLAPGPVSPGEIITVFGSVPPTPPPTILFNGVPAPILYAGQNQVNAIVPFGLDLSNPAQVVIQQGSASTTVTVPVAAAAPAIFTLNANGSGAGAVLNQDYSINSPSNPATPGSVIMVYGTGFGALTPPPADGQIAYVLSTTNSEVTATIGGVPADVLYAGAAPGLIAGITQVNVRVPPGIAAGAAQPISLSMGAFTTPAAVTISVK